MFVLRSNRRNEKIRILLQMLLKVRKSCRDCESLLKCLASSVELSSLEEVWAFFRGKQKSILCFVWYKQSIKQVDIFQIWSYTVMTNSLIFQLSNSCQISMKKNHVKNNIIKLVFFRRTHNFLYYPI